MRSCCAIAVTIAVVVATGCRTVDKGKIDTAPAPPPKAAVQPLVAAFSRGCIVPLTEVTRVVPEAGLAATLLAAIIPKAAGAAVDFVGGLLQKAGEDKTTVSQATAGPYLYRVMPFDSALKARRLDLMPDARCLHLMSFQGDSEDWGQLVAGTTRLPAAATTVQQNLGMMRRPAPTFYMEFLVLISEDEAHFKLIPTFLKYGRAFSGASRKAELLSAINFSHPGADKPFASTTVLLRGLSLGQTYDAHNLWGSSSEWMPLDKPSELAAEAKGAPPATGIIEKARLFDPINATTVVTETQDGIKLLKALGELISGTKEEVAKAVAAKLPSEETKAAADASRLDDRNAHVTAMAEVAVKEAELATKTDAVERARAQADVVKAKLEANKTALKAGIALPFGELYAPRAP